MESLILQFTIKHWDKSQQTERHVKQRQALATHHTVCLPPAITLANQRIILDQHGDNLPGNRIRYQLTDQQHFLIDRFRFDLNAQTIEFKPQLDASTEPVLLIELTSNSGWVQCCYQWRYRVDDGEFIYWLYEAVTLNACFVSQLEQNVFMDSEPKQQFRDLI